MFRAPTESRVGIHRIEEDSSVWAGLRDDLHAFGATIILNEKVRGDAMLFGQKVIVGPNVRVTGTTVVGGQVVTIQGTYDEDARFFAEDSGGTAAGND